MKKKIIFCSGGTGGHVFPTISLISFFKEKDYDTIFITDVRGLKYIKKNHFLGKIIELNFSSQTGSINKILFYFKLILAFFKSYLILIKEKPNFVFGLGGYVSFPMCLAAKLLNIKILLYEPNLVLGRVNRFFLGFCCKLFTNSNSIKNLSYKHLAKCIEVGNIIRQEILEHRILTNKTFNSEKKILILGGSQGAEVFGKVIPQVILDLSNNYKVNIIQQSYLNRLMKLKIFIIKII